jgi:hypothetical protein
MDISPEALAAMIGVFMPVVVSLLKRATWPTWAKLGVAGGVSLAVGAVSTLVSTQVDVEPESILTAAAAAFTASTLVYRLWFENTVLNDRLAAFPSK